jgi:hypothetical protein
MKFIIRCLAAVLAFGASVPDQVGRDWRHVRTGASC